VQKRQGFLIVKPPTEIHGPPQEDCIFLSALEKQITPIHGHILQKQIFLGKKALGI